MVCEWQSWILAQSHTEPIVNALFMMFLLVDHTSPMLVAAASVPSSFSAVIQVVDLGIAKEFDCFSEVPCAVTGPSVVILGGSNTWCVKVLFAGGPTGRVEAAAL